MRSNCGGLVLLNLFFYPDTAATSQLLTDVARELARFGPVTAISGAAASGAEVVPGVKAIRTRNFAFGRSTNSRLKSYGSFLLAAVWRVMRIPRPEVVLTLTTPPMISLLGTLLKTRRGARHYIWEMDVYPDVATDLGVFQRDGLFARLLTGLANWSRHRADGIIVLGEEMKARLLAQGIPAQKITVCENWADGREIKPVPFPDGPLAVLYAGNFGLPHEFHTVAGAIRRLGRDPRFRFIFSGGGTRFEDLRRICRDSGLTNVDFQPFCSRAELGAKLGQGHLGLVTQVPETLGSLVPSKTYGIMAAGRPVLYIGPPDATPARHIQRFQCGWRADPGDVENLVCLLETLEAHRHSLYDSGRRARAAFEEHFDVNIGIARLAAAIGVHQKASDAPRELALPAEQLKEFKL